MPHRPFTYPRTHLVPWLELLAVVTLFALLAPSFATFHNLRALLVQGVVVGMAALGARLVMLSGGVDLSVGAQLALGSVATATLLNLMGGGSGGGVGTVVGTLAGLGGVVTCVACGLLVGAVVTRFALPTFLVTLGAAQVVRGAARALAGGRPVATPLNGLEELMYDYPEEPWMVFAPAFWLLLLLLGATLLAQRRPGGRALLQAPTGERSGWRRVGVYALAGAFTGVAAVMQHATLALGDPEAAGTTTVEVIAAVLLGGGAWRGDAAATATGTVAGAFVLAVIHNGCTLLGVAEVWQQVIVGTLLVALVASDGGNRQVGTTGGR